MPKMFLPLGKMNLERGALDGDHAWVIKDLMATSHGYEQAPVLSAVTTAGLPDSNNPKGGINWRGEGSPRMYIGTYDRIYEVAGSTFTNVSRSSAYSNHTNGPSFASYGKKCYHSNGIDKINSIIVPSSTGGTENFSDITYSTDSAVIAPKYICSHKNHLIGANIKMLAGYGGIDDASTTGIATPFTQPATSRLEAVSSDAGDTTQTITIYGCKGSDTVVVEAIALNGTTAVGTIAPHTWTKILAIQKSAVTVGTVTLQVYGGGAAVTTLAPATLVGGIYNVSPSASAGDSYVDIVCDTPATTKQVGLIGLDAEGVTIYDSQALASTTTVQSNSKFKTIANILIGDVPIATTVTINTYQFATTEQYEYLVWISGTDLPEGYGDPQVTPTIVGSDYRYLFDGIGTITGVIDGGDCFFVFKSGSIVRLDGPPFQPTVINYNIGMRPGNVPYRQGDRVYFWSSKGLSYIDIRSNEVIHVFEDAMQRSVLDAGSKAVTGSSVGYFPDQKLTTISIVNASSTTSRVSIAGDPEYNLIFVSYYNGSSNYGTDDSTILCYNVNLDSFTLLDGPVGNTANGGLVLDYDNDATSSFPGSVIRIFRITASFTLTMYSYSSGGLVGLASTACPYIRYPFKSVDPTSSRSRIARVRPIFDNISYIGDSSATMAGTQVDILSISGVAKSWTTDSVISSGSGTYSADGWYDTSNCKFADKHSIGVHFAATADGGTASSAIIIAGLVGVEVEFVLEPSRSL